MSDDRTLPVKRSAHTNRTTPSRPPIEWPTRSVQQQSVDSERAAAYARERVARAYGNAPSQAEPSKNQTIVTPEPASTPDETVQEFTKTQDSPVETPVEHDGPSKQHPQPPFRNTTYDVGEYHNAWQQYYRQYFYRYYASWWQQQRHHIASEAKQHAEEELRANQAFTHSEPEDMSEAQKVSRELRKKLRETAESRAEKVKRSTHFKPALAGLAVAVSFLLINYNQVMVGAVKQYIAPGNVVTTPVIVEPNTQTKIGPEPRIVIPKIGVDAPVVYDEPNVDEASYQRALERGVVRLGTTADPGTQGNVVIGGHSSNNVFNAGGYKYVFVNLKQLDVGDVFYLNYNGTRYTYKVTVAKKIISPKDTSVLEQTATPTVTLFTCDPPGTNINRLIVQATQIDPDPNGATAGSSTKPQVNAANPLPSVAPSLLDRLIGLFGN